MGADSDRQDELDRLAEVFVERRRSGEAVSISAFARAHPAHAEDIRQIFPLLDAIEGIKPIEEGPRPPTRVGPYEIVREVGRGGMGVVYEAMQGELGRRVALKLLPIQATLDPRFLDRFRQEAQAAARLQHPHIVPVIGYGEHDGIHYYSMQFVEGRGLDEVIRDEAPRLATASTGALRAWFRRSAGMMLDAAEGVAHAHAHGVLHRDLKPANLMLDDENCLWIADFGLCREEGSAGLTASGEVLGTFRYLPPERFRGSSDVRGDVYGLGITLYELLTRERAYPEVDPAALAARITDGPPLRPRAIDRRIPLDLETIVRTATAHDPGQRYATVEALAADLRAWLAGRPVQARRPTFGYLARSLVQRHKAITATLVTAVLVIAAASLLYVEGLKEKEARARQREYAATVAAVESAMRLGDTERADLLLQSAPPEFRNWEWRHLASRLDDGMRRFESLPSEVRAVAYHPDGSHFAAAIGEHMWVYEEQSGRVVARLETGAGVTSLRWRSDGDAIAVGTYEGLEVWSWPTATRRFRSVDRGEFRHVDFTDEGGTVVGGDVDGRIVSYDVESGEETGRVGLATRVLCLACPPSGRGDHVLVGTGDGCVSVVERDTGRLVWSEEVSRRGLHAVAYLDDERVGYTLSEGLAGVRDAQDGTLIRALPLRGEGGPIVGDPLGTRFLVLAAGELHVWDARTWAPLQIVSRGSRPSRAALHPSGRRAIVASTSGFVREWYLGERGDLRVLGRHMDDVLSADLDPGGRWLASGGWGGEVRIFDVEAGALARVLYGHGDVILRLRFAPDGRHLASMDGSGEVVVWTLPEGTIQRRWRPHPGHSGTLCFLPGSGDLITMRIGAAMARWDIETGAKRAERALEEGLGTRLATDRAGTRIAVGGMNGAVVLLDAATLATACAVQGHTRQVTGLAFHPREPVLATVSSDQRLRLWNAADLAPIRSSAQEDPSLGWSEGLLSVTFSPDGTRIAAGSYTGRILLWDTSDLRPCARLKGDPSWVTDVFFDPPGERMFTALSNGTVRIWDTRPLRDRVAGFERAALLRAEARPIVDMLETGPTRMSERLARLAERRDLPPAVREAAVRLVHQRGVEHEALLARAWSAALPRKTDADELRIAHGLAVGMWRAMHHKEMQDPRCATLLGLVRLRLGDPAGAVWAADHAGAKNRLRAPELYAIDLAVRTIGLAGLSKQEAGDAALADLDAWLAAHPTIRTERVRALAREARAAVNASTPASPQER